MKLENLLKQDKLVKAIRNVAGTEIVAAAERDNPFKGLIQPVHAPQLNDANDWIIVEKNLVRQFVPPWIAARYDAGPELSLRVYDESSELFRDEGMIAMSNHIWYGFAAVFPHAVRRVTGA